MITTNALGIRCCGWLLASLASLATLASGACSSGGNGNKNIDAPRQSGSDSGSNIHHDSGADAAPAPAMITVSGNAQAQTTSGPGSNVVGATIDVFDAANPATALGTMATDGSGNFSITVPTGGVALNGYVKATASGYVDSYLWPPAPLTANYTGASVNFISSTDEALATGVFCQVSGGQGSSSALIGLEVEDGSGNTIGSAVVKTDPAAGKACYDGSNGLPSAAETSTYTDGVALMINVPAGDITLSATKSGSTFTSHTVTGVAGAFTTTIIVEQ
jgi:hypothetical protein